MKPVLRIWLGVVIAMILATAVIGTIIPAAVEELTKMTLSVAAAGLVTWWMYRIGRSNKPSLAERRHATTQAFLEAERVERAKHAKL